VRDNFTELPTHLPHWPKRLAEAGYETAYLGKWHMGENNDEPRPGFSLFATHKGQGKYFDTEWNINGEGGELIKGYYTTVVTDMALDWLKKDHANKPWALCIGHKAPHSFYTPEDKYAHAFDHVPVHYPDSAFHLENKPSWIKERLTTWHGIYGPLFEWRKQFPDERPEAVKDFENMVHGYWGTILSVDDSMGRPLCISGTNPPVRKHCDRLHGRQRITGGRTWHGGQTHGARALFEDPTPGALPDPWKRKVIDQQALTVDVAPAFWSFAEQRLWMEFTASPG
jgi:N-acetylglucosamine-6-sulfatase